ncbi:hypothetical protein ACQ4PT_002522 [Festuca glaucescens]
MAGGPMLQLWNEWATQILVLLSFTLQIFLFVFARTRRHGSSAVLRILLWLVYLMGSWLTPLLSTLSAISQSMVRHTSRSSPCSGRPSSWCILVARTPSPAMPSRITSSGHATC